MNSFYKSIGLFEELTFVTESNKTEFVLDLEKLIYKSNFGIFEVSEYSIPNRYEYRGIVNDHDFIIRRRKRFFENTIPNPKIKGRIDEKNGETYITVVFMPLTYHVLRIVFLVIVFSIIIVNMNHSKNNEMIFIILIPVFAVLTQYFIVKRGIAKEKYNFARELNFIINKRNRFKMQ